jgi:hypothetical protein
MARKTAVNLALRTAKNYLYPNRIARRVVPPARPKVEHRLAYSGDPSLSHLSKAVHTAMQAALASEGKVPPELLSLHGMSGRKYRLFINSLVELCPNPRYLEIGTCAGSTLCSAIYGNKVKALAIDNWSEFGGPTNTFYANLALFSSSSNKLSILNADFRSVDYSNIGKFNIYLFDGPHEEQDQYDALALTQKALDQEFVFIVDDWNWKQVRDGTLKAIDAIGATPLYIVEVFPEVDGKASTVTHENSEWHNGYYIAVLRRHA